MREYSLDLTVTKLNFNLVGNNTVKQYFSDLFDELERRSRTALVSGANERVRKTIVIVISVE